MCLPLFQAFSPPWCFVTCADAPHTRRKRPLAGAAATAAAVRRTRSRDSHARATRRPPTQNGSFLPPPELAQALPIDLQAAAGRLDSCSGFWAARGGWFIEQPTLRVHPASRGGRLGTALFANADARIVEGYAGYL